MNIPDFDFEFYSEVPDPGDELRAESLERLLALAEGHDDLIGASVALEELTGATTPYRYQVRVIAFIRPDNIAAVEKAETSLGALKGALTALERQVREYREKLRETWKRS
ncbi:MAG: HPF/RaiA family ribosome-associated protein [Anaerolineae bacterium]